MYLPLKLVPTASALNYCVLKSRKLWNCIFISYEAAALLLTQH